MQEINSNNTCSVIVTYNPDDSLINNVRRIASFSYKVIIVDNGSNEVDALFRSLQAEISNLRVVVNASNLGIAKALNIGIKSALEFAPKWIFTFDQDSLPYPEFVSVYNRAILKLHTDSFGLLSCQFSDVFHPVPEDIRVKQKHTIITSGCLHNTEVFSTVGFYNESLFIDCVDFDYSLRVAKAGYKTYRISQYVLLHHLGNPQYRRFLLWNVSSTNHSLMRRYYMSRNHFFLSKLYFGRFPLFIIKKNFFFLLIILQLLYVERNRKEKLKVMWRGFKDSRSIQKQSYI